VPVPRRFDRRPPERDTTRINERIRVPEVRLIDELGNQVGVMRTDEALKYATSKELDLVEVAPEAKPPVCRVLDYSKYKYEQAQKVKQAKKHQQQIVVREIKFRPKIAEHDYATKKGHVERFLRHKDKVKITIMFRGREVTHPERGVMILDRLAEDLAELCQVDQRPIQDGRNMTMLLAPSKAVLADALDDGHEDDGVDLDSLEDRDDQLPSAEAVPESETPASDAEAPEGTDAPPGDESAVLAGEAKTGRVKPTRTIQSDAEKPNIVVTDDGSIVGAEDEALGALPPPPKQKAPAKKAAPKKAPASEAPSAGDAEEPAVAKAEEPAAPKAEEPAAAKAEEPAAAKAEEPAAAKAEESTPAPADAPAPAKAEEPAAS
jgi:translation initiation factor IF-3